jgi:CelD/BcsL family acetyltransferase involved in cellulose biosynthesis
MESIAEEWNDLLKNSASHVPFLRQEYLSAWWQTLGGGEWAGGELYVVTARKENGALAGIAPLFFTHNREGVPALMLLGSVEISDYLDVIASHEDLILFVSTLFDHLASPQAPDWHVLDWWNFLDNSPALPVLQAAASGHGWDYSQELLQHCPYIPLPGDWETYLAGIDGKQRHEIKRKMRRAESHFLPLRWRIIENEAELDEAVDEFLRLMAYDTEKNRFLTEPMRQQYHIAARTIFKAGWLQLSFLEVDGVNVASYMNFDYMNRIWVYNSGIDFSYRELSPGWVLLGYLLQWANVAKRETYDFMRGDEEYKYRFGAIDRRVVRVIIRR